jgi:GNAT superfamily N-acetyltransferase
MNGGKARSARRRISHANPSLIVVNKLLCLRQGSRRRPKGLNSRQNGAASALLLFVLSFLTRPKTCKKYRAYLNGEVRMAIEIRSGPGSSFSVSDQEAFIALVLSGDEVPEHTLRTNVPCAEALIFLHDDGNLHGVAALKVPQPSYRDHIRRKSGTAVPSAAFPLELGYILVAPAALRRGHSRRLVDEALRVADARGVFATSRADNHFMHKTLVKSGFEPTGQAYPSKQRPGTSIQLFLRPQAGRSANDGAMR